VGVGSRFQLTIFGRAGCHLCDEMLSDVAKLQDGFDVEVRYVDIDGDPELAEKFNDFVPVLMHGDRELCRYRLNSDSVRAYLADIR
jgi:hypothetical protein